MNKKKALITGVTGQCGSYLSRYLLNLGYEVHGLNRRKSVDNFANILDIKDSIQMIEGDITDASSVSKLMGTEKYDVCFNTAAQSHVGTSFSQPQTTMEINVIGVINLLEAIRYYSSHTRFVQMSSSEMFGSSLPPQNEHTIFHPRSSYAVSKAASYYLVQNYHESFNLRCASAICFNFESRYRGKLFVTRKITEWIKAFKKNNTVESLRLGNLSAKRDWTFCGDTVDALYKIAYQDVYFNGLHGNYWKSYCVGSGKSYSIREFIEYALTIAFDLDEFSSRFTFTGQGLNEAVFDKSLNRNIIVVDSEFFRPSEVNDLQCDPSLIKTELGWEPSYTLREIIIDMLSEDLLPEIV